MDTASALAKVTVVVPVGPGDALSPRLRGQLDQLPSKAQVRVVLADGEVALHHATGPGPQWQVMSAPCGRALQQNAGARDAAGEWLWFLHADCVLAADSLPALARFIDANPGPGAAALGYFDLRFLDDGPSLMRLNAAGAWLRSRWLGLPFGDQGLVLPRAVFERLGGFDPGVEHGEEHELVWRLRRAGVPLRPVGAPLFTSARKYAERGWWTTTARHLRETWRQARRFSRAEAMR